MSKGKVLVGMSGGVDSSVSAALLAEEGYEVTGCTMRLYDYTGIGLPEQNTCCGIDDVNDAASVARTIGADFRVINFMTEFRQEVMQKFVNEYLRGNTPNPCIDCNRRMKFGLMKKWALENGFDYIATGHYARKVFLNGRWYLQKGVDMTK
jgi:tRNA-specific 2-thiouridylase